MQICALHQRQLFLGHQGPSACRGSNHRTSHELVRPQHRTLFFLSTFGCLLDRAHAVHSFGRERDFICINNSGSKRRNDGSYLSKGQCPGRMSAFDKEFSANLPHVIQGKSLTVRWLLEIFLHWRRFEPYTWGAYLQLPLESIPRSFIFIL